MTRTPNCLSIPRAVSWSADRKATPDSPAARSSSTAHGAIGRNGGGAFSGKDPTKVDRSGAYAARHVAKNIVAAGLAPVAEVELCYAIGVSQPVSVQVDTRGTAVVSEEVITDWVREHVDLSPDGIINRFELRRPIYKQVAAYGHFGRPELDLPWEKLDLVDALRADFKEYLKD